MGEVALARDGEAGVLLLAAPDKKRSEPSRSRAVSKAEPSRRELANSLANRP
jgi:hypothetical protein